MPSMSPPFLLKPQWSLMPGCKRRAKCSTLTRYIIFRNGRGRGWQLSQAHLHSLQPAQPCPRAVRGCVPVTWEPWRTAGLLSRRCWGGRGALPQLICVSLQINTLPVCTAQGLLLGSTGEEGKKTKIHMWKIFLSHFMRNKSVIKMIKLRYTCTYQIVICSALK